MSRETSPFIYGDFWLDKRRDGQSPDIWQLASYSPKSRSVIYRSTRTDALEGPNGAKAVIIAHVEKLNAKKAQPADAALIVPQLFLYYDEHGQYANGGKGAATIAGSLRIFIGFMLQDEIGPGATIADLNPQVFERFRRWRMGAHSFSVPWKDKDYDHASTGVRGESVQRNLDDLRAALNHAALHGRIPYAPKVPSVKQAFRSPARDVRLTIQQLGAILGFVWDEIEMRRWVQLMIATGSRPDACLAFNPADQWIGDLLDMHPPHWPRTKKRNPVVPQIAPMKPILDAWKKAPHVIAKARRTQWRTMRRALELPENIVPKTIRHTIATELLRRGVPHIQISGLLGHVGMNRTTAVYAKYDPNFLKEAKAMLTKIFREVEAEAKLWRADHLRTKTGNNPVAVIKRGKEKVA